MQPITVALAGAGQRANDLAQYALRHPDEIKFVAVAEPSEARREMFRDRYGLAAEMCYAGWEEMLAQPRLAEAILIGTGDDRHFAPAMQAMDLGYHVFLEKPMAVAPRDCLSLADRADERGRILLVGHVLRYTSFFAAIKRLLAGGRIGRLISIQHNENVGFWHMAHSYVRGNWRRADQASPMILAKSCHDLDILLWLAGTDCLRLSSFGALTHFRRQNAPAGAPARCLDGCPEEEDCPYHAGKIYLTAHTGWPASVISADTGIEARTRALRGGPYGRCVFHCDNDVVDHQVVNLEFANGVTAAFTMCAFTREISRTIKLMGTAGEIRGVLEQNKLEVHDFRTGDREVIRLRVTGFGHGGGDDGIMRAFVRLVREDGADTGLTSARESVQSHLLAFAAETARLERRVVEMDQYIHNLTAKG